MPVIYLDVLLALNLLIDFLLLTATAAWQHLPHRRWRRIVAAMIGAVSAGVVLLPPLPWWGQFLFDVAVAAAMVRTAFAWRSWALFGKTLGTLYLLSAGLSGACTLLVKLFSPIGFQVINGTVYYDIPPITLVICTVVSYGALSLFEHWARPRRLARHTYRITAEFGGKTAQFYAFYDSGNLLTEGYSGAGIIVVERSALGGWEAPSDAVSAAAQGFRLIPYRTAAGEALCPAFRPDKLTAQVGTHAPQNITGVYLAVVDRLGGEIQAVIGDPVIQLLQTERTATV
ncbi:MAG: sigma-E processing peptidase SpoIIGA [Clostridia bacterium]|nr:sigma-E processing peptidase SpoIIGA [Clostridia bacterium]